MRKIKFILFQAALIVTFSFKSYAQSKPVPNFDNIKMEKESDYKLYDAKALEAATYYLQTNENTPSRKKAITFLIQWMSGTPDYSFMVDASVVNISDNNPEITTLYMASMAKYALENKEKMSDNDAIKLGTYNYLLDYVENKQNNISKNKEMKKLIKARKNGKLAEAIKL